MKWGVLVVFMALSAVAVDMPVDEQDSECWKCHAAWPEDQGGPLTALLDGEVKLGDNLRITLRNPWLHDLPVANATVTFANVNNVTLEQQELQSQQDGQFSRLDVTPQQNIHEFVLPSGLTRATWSILEKTPDTYTVLATDPVGDALYVDKWGRSMDHPAGLPGGVYTLTVDWDASPKAVTADPEYTLFLHAIGLDRDSVRVVHSKGLQPGQEVHFDIPTVRAGDSEYTLHLAGVAKYIHPDRVVVQEDRENVTRTIDYEFPERGAQYEEAPSISWLGLAVAFIGLAWRLRR